MVIFILTDDLTVERTSAMYNYLNMGHPDIWGDIRCTRGALKRGVV